MKSKSELLSMTVCIAMITPFSPTAAYASESVDGTETSPSTLSSDAAALPSAHNDTTTRSTGRLSFTVNSARFTDRVFTMFNAAN